MTIRDLHDYLGSLIDQGLGECVVKAMYDGFIEEIESPDDLLTRQEHDMEGIISGTVNKGDFLIET